MDIYFLHSTACLILLGQLKSGQNGLWSWASNGHILFGRGDSFGTVIYLEITPTGKGHSWRIYPPKIGAGQFPLPKGFVAPFREGVSYRNIPIQTLLCLSIDDVT